MSLSKQFYISLGFILFIMFSGNAILNIKNSQESLASQYTNKTVHIETNNVPSWFVEYFPMNNSKMVQPDSDWIKYDEYAKKRSPK